MGYRHMCNPLCISFVESNLREEEVRGRRVLEVGSMDVNGSVRPAIERLHPRSYLGVDITEGPRVDCICRAEDLVARFGRASFDVVISSEMLEHVRDWRRVISNLKHVLAPGGSMLITTRSRGKLYHAYPHDFWRFEIGDMERIFGDLEIQALEKDPYSPGVFLKALKPENFSEVHLPDYKLFSILTEKRMWDVGLPTISWFMARYVIKDMLKRILPGWAVSMIRSARKSLR